MTVFAEGFVEAVGFFIAPCLEGAAVRGVEAFVAAADFGAAADFFAADFAGACADFAGRGVGRDVVPAADFASDLSWFSAVVAEEGLADSGTGVPG
jgi:hypothetical protein